MGEEIKVVRSELDTQIMNLGKLSAGTRFKNSSELVKRGYSDTADALNELWTELHAVETVMMEVLEQTKTALTNAGVQFDEADWVAGQMLGQVGNATEVVQNVF